MCLLCHREESRKALICNTNFAIRGDNSKLQNIICSQANVKCVFDATDVELLIFLKSVLLDIGQECKNTLTEWLEQYWAKLKEDDINDLERLLAMDSVNPKYVLRNYLCQSAIDLAEQQDYNELWRSLDVMKRPMMSSQEWKSMQDFHQHGHILLEFVCYRVLHRMGCLHSLL